MTSYFRESADLWTPPPPRAYSAGRVLLLLILCAAPMPFGAVYTWAWASLTVATLLTLGLWNLGTLQRAKLALGVSPLYAPIVLFLIVGLLQLRFHLTLTPVATRESLLKTATYAVIFFLAIQLFNRVPGEIWRKLGLAVLIFAFVFSFLSILQFFWNSSRIIWVSHELAGVPFGSYVDRDHYAGLMELLIPLSAGYVLSRPRHDPLNGLLWLGVLIPMVSLLLTGSRGGFIAMIVEILVLVGMMMGWNRVPGRRTRVAATGASLVAAAALFFWLAPSFIMNKIGTVNSYVPEAKEGSRLILWRNALEILRDHPLAGAGMGSFETVYPTYQTEPINLVFDHAHNDYVETLAETGFLGGALLAVGLLFFILITVKNLSAGLGSEQSWIQLGAAVACYGMLVHSFVDFNLHIPANAAWFAFCAGLATLPGRGSRKRNEWVRA